MNPLLKVAAVFIASAVVSHGANTFITLTGNPADYEAELQTLEGSSPSTAARRGDAEGLRVLADPFIPGFGVNEGRAIFQFNLHDLGTAGSENTVVDSALLRFTLLSATPDIAFGVEVWGRQSNNSAVISVDNPESNAGGQFGGAGYDRLGPTGLQAGAGEITTPVELSLDITAFMNDRFQSFHADDDGWIIIRLQADTLITPTSLLAGAYTFASADHPDAAFQPELDLALIPEPTTVAAALGLGALMLVFLRRQRRNR